MSGIVLAWKEGTKHCRRQHNNKKPIAWVLIFMSLLPVHHAGFLAGGQEARSRAAASNNDKDGSIDMMRALGVSSSRLGSPRTMGATSTVAPGFSPFMIGRTSFPMPHLMASVACRDGTLPVSRTFTPSPPKEDGKNGRQKKEDTSQETSSKPQEKGKAKKAARTEEVESKIMEPITETYNLSYRIFRPMTLSSKQACPIVVLHGGPSVPSDYLYPLVDVVPYRSIVFYDQLGCGRSDVPQDVNA
jgi:hypothetical protein